MSTVARSRLYLITGVAVAAIVVTGFSRSYVLRPLFDLPALTLLLHLHAAAFMAWLAVFITQVSFVSARRIDLHRKLGIAGGFLASLMVLATIGCIVEVIPQQNRLIGGVPGWKWMALSSVSIVLFAAFVGAALALRRRPEWHKRFMMIATIGLIGPAVGRLLIMAFGVPAARYSSYVLGALLLWCLAYDWFRHRLVHPAFVIGTVVLLGAIPVKQMLANSQAWRQLTLWIAAQ